MPKRLNFWFYIAVALLTLDIAMIYACIKLVHIVRLDAFYPVRLFPFSIIAILSIGFLYTFNTYQFYRGRRPYYMALVALIAVYCSGLVLAALLYATKSTDYNSLFWRGNLPLTMILYSLWAALSRFFLSKWYLSTVKSPKWVIIAQNANPEQAVLEAKKYIPKDSVVYTTYNDDAVSDLKALENEGKINKSTHIFLISPSNRNNTLDYYLMQLRMRGVKIFSPSTFYEQYAFKVPVQNLQNNFFVYAEGFELIHHDIQLKIKRIFDIAVSSLGLIISIIPIILIGIVIKLTSEGPVLYKQIRCGERNSLFMIRKFRTMIVNSEPEGAKWAQKNDPRITKFGSFLRKSRLDELPQLWNILKGDMSFIGPRPERPEFVEKLEEKIPYYDLRHTVKPGLTGWAQVMYPYGNTEEDALAKLEYDLFYIKNYSLTLEVYILIRTIRTVISRAGL